MQSFFSKKAKHSNSKTWKFGKLGKQVLLNILFSIVASWIDIADFMEHNIRPWNDKATELTTCKRKTPPLNTDNLIRKKTTNVTSF